MVVATVHIKEFNDVTARTNPPANFVGADGDSTDDVSQLNLVSIDQAEASSSANPVTAGNRSVSKWVAYELHAKNDSNQIDNFQVWMTKPGAYATGVEYKTNLNTTLGSTGSTYPAPPTAADFTGVGEGDVVLESDVDLTDPAAQNIGISEGTGALSVNGYHSDLIAFQLVTTGSTPPGNLQQKTFHFQYDEQ